MHKYLQFAQKTAEKASKKLMSYYKKRDTSIRGTPTEIKTIYDEIADTIIKKEIEKKFPHHSYLTEETGLVKKNPRMLWVIDPLDGTGNFVNGNPFFAVSIALWKDDEPMIAVIDAPALNECYMAQKGMGAWLINKKRKIRVAVSQTNDLQKAYLIFCEGGSKEKTKVLQFFNPLYPQVKDMRKLGAASIELAWVGVGRGDAYITTEIHLWDIGAGILFVQEAGGKILHFNLNPWSSKKMPKLDGIDLIATNGHLPLPKIPATIQKSNS